MFAAAAQLSGQLLVGVFNSAELVDQFRHVERLDRLAEAAQAHLLHEHVVLRCVTDRDRGLGHLEGGKDVVVTRGHYSVDSRHLSHQITE